MFYRCDSILNFDAPLLETIEERGLDSCRELRFLKLKKLKTVHKEGFANCWGLETLILPSLTTVHE